MATTTPRKKTRKKRVGRKRRTAALADRMLYCRVTPAELAAIERAARAAGQTLSDFIRSRALGD